MILNAAFGPVSDLPFDLRMKRVIIYSMQEKAEDRAAKRRDLETRLTSALQEIFRQLGHSDGEAAKRGPLRPPQMEIVSPGSHFGRLDSKGGQFALLLKVRFRNESTQPTLIQHFRIQYAGKWYPPTVHAGSISLHVLNRSFGGLLRLEDSVTKSPHIPAMDEIERSAFFLLPDPQEPFPGPGELHLIAEATFAHRNPQQLTFMLTDQGEMKQNGMV